MELQFEKKEQPFLNQIMRSVKEQELTQEVRLTDAMPDVGRVIGGWGQVILRGKEWQGSRMGVSGGVMAWILYAPEDGTAPQTVNAWLPFQMKWDGAQTDREGLMRVQPLLRFVDGRNLSARKILIRAGVSCLAEGLYEAKCDVYHPREDIEAVELLRRSYPVRLPREAGEQTISLEETLDPGGMNIRQLLAYSLVPEITEARVSGDKAVIRGIVRLHVLFGHGEDAIGAKDFEVPVSQLAQLDKAYESDAAVDVVMAVTGAEAELSEEKIALKASLTAQYIICERSMVELVEDAYSTRREVGLRQEELYLPSILEDRKERITAQAELTDSVGQVIDCAFLPGHPVVVRNGDQTQIEITGRFQLLGWNMEGMLRTLPVSWTGYFDLAADAASQLDAVHLPDGNVQMISTSSGCELRCEMGLQISTRSGQGMPMITGLELGAVQDSDRLRPSLILRRADGCRLWDLAKASGSSVSAIMAANGLEEEPKDHRMLLIPVN